MTFHGKASVLSTRGAISVASAELGDALHGDQVEVEVREGRAAGRLHGRIARVIERSYQRLTGVFDPERGFLPDDGRFHRPLRCRRPAAYRGDVLYGAELSAKGSEAEPETRLVVSFGERGVAADELDAMLWREEVEDGFPAAALEEARRSSRASQAPSSTHEDLRALPFVTIDPVDAEDHDDALFAEQLSGGRVRCCVAIADVASLVASGGALDLEARERGASLYLPGRLIPMLPRCISADAASLVPDQDRRAVVLDVILDESGRVLSRKLKLAVIRSRERLSYDEAADLLWDPESTPAEVRRFADAVWLLDDVASTLRKRRAERGALLVETPSVRVEADADGEPLHMRQVRSDRFRKRACGLVEELMLLANESVAEMLREAGLTSFCRSHAAPLMGRLSLVARAAEQYGVKLSTGGLEDLHALRREINAIADTAARSALQAALLDIMPAAVYATEQRDHFALASRDYVHFTSPIRRYPDVLVHRAVRALIMRARNPVVQMDIAELNQKQQRARRIHHETTSLYGSILATELVGVCLRGVVTRVGHRDALVLADDPAVTIRCPTGTRRLVHGARVVVVAERVDVGRRSVQGRLVRVA
jgi:ribonuclease R